jgi:DNA-binding CsgD family transcriptional regulator
MKKWSEHDPAGLSEHERRVVELLRIGRSTRQIAGSMSISLNSTYTYIQRVMIKTHTHSRAELIMKIDPWTPADVVEQEIEGVAVRGSA